MQTVSLSRDLDATAESVEAALDDVAAFTKAGGFDEVEVEDNRMHLKNGVGIATMELTVEFFESDEAALAYRQVEGIFDEMETRYTVETTARGSQITGTTSFEVDMAVVGDLLDATVIKRQRRREIEGQFDWLEAEVT